MREAAALWVLQTSQTAAALSSDGGRQACTAALTNLRQWPCLPSAALLLQAEEGRAGALVPR